MQVCGGVDGSICSSMTVKDSVVGTRQFILDHSADLHVSKNLYVKQVACFSLCALNRDIARPEFQRAD